MLLFHAGTRIFRLPLQLAQGWAKYKVLIFLMEKTNSCGDFLYWCECVSKSMNVGNLFRSAHAFGAGFVFTVDNMTEEKAARPRARPTTCRLQLP